MGVISRNTKGEALGAVELVVDEVMDPEAIEIIAAIKMLDFTLQMGFTRVSIEGDALNIVNRINQVTSNIFSIGHIVEEAKFLMRGFQLCKM